MKTLPVTSILLFPAAFAAHAHPGHEPGAADSLAWSSGELWSLVALAGAGLAFAAFALYRRRKAGRADG